MQQAIGDVAAGIGHVLRAMLYLLGWAPVVAGPALVLYGISQYSRPAACIAAGLAICVLTFARPNPRRGRSK